jgi:hypothetical protein
MKFLNKKEQVFDIQLTPYGKQKLSMGELKPTHYAFFDDNILYDIEYAHSGASEVQNDTHKRIKEETQYLESQVIFKQVLSGTMVAGGTFTEITIPQPASLYTRESYIGDALLQSQEQDVAPAWKVIAMQGTISSSNSFLAGTLDNNSQIQRERNGGITQINIDANYELKAQQGSFRTSVDNIRNIQDTSQIFSDDTVVRLISEDALVYVEELNTELLTENFDIEVFEVPESGETGELRRLYFENEAPQVVNGMLVRSTPFAVNQSLTTSSVEYYFSIDKDYQIEPKIACKYLNQFNTEDYLIDLDFDCEEQDEDLFFDIYGRVTESEICPD